MTVTRRDQEGRLLCGDAASVYANTDFILIETNSGYRGSVRDFRGVQHFLKSAASDWELGEAILDAMSHSRFVLSVPRKDVWQHPDVEFDQELYDYVKTQERHKAWKADLMRRYGYKTQRALFKGMKHCFVERNNGLITIQPWHHEKLEAWSGLEIDENVILSADSSVDQIGAALRLAFSRCT